VLERLLTGATNKEIAADIGVSEQCVKYHLTKLFHKFRVDTRVALALAANRIIGSGPLTARPGKPGSLRPPRDGFDGAQLDRP